MKPKMTKRNIQYQVWWNNFCIQTFRNRLKIAFAILIGRKL